MVCHCHPGWTNADAVAATREFLSGRPSRRAAVRELTRGLLSADRMVRRSAADLARRVSAREPGVLHECFSLFLELMDLPENEWQSRGYATLAAALNASTRGERLQVLAPVRRMLEDERIALKAIALEAFAILAMAEQELRNDAISLLDQARFDVTPAIRCRARRMLSLLLGSERFRPERRKAGELPTIVLRKDC